MANRMSEALLRKNGGNQSEMARYVGVTPQAVQKWMSGLTEPRGANLRKAAEFLGMPVSVMKFGIEPTGEICAWPMNNLAATHRAEKGEETFLQIPIVKLRLQAGVEGFQVEPEHRSGAKVGLRRDWLERNGYDLKSLIAITVKGHSMETTLFDGDLVVINTTDKTPVDGVTFAVNYEGELVVKRLSRDAGKWWLTSDNSDQRRHVRKLCHGEACIIVGRIVRKESDRI